VKREPTLDSWSCTLLGLLFGVFLLWLSITVASGAFSHFLQGRIYNQPADGFIWRAPASGAIITLTIGLWMMLDYSSPGIYRPIHELQSYIPDNKKASLKPDEGAPYPSMTVTRADGKKEVYFKQPGTRLEYKSKINMPLPSTPVEIEVEEEGKILVFKPEKDAKGNYLRRTGQPLVYKDERKRQMIEGGLGALVINRPGATFLVLFLHLLHFLAWFACLWFLFEFQPLHAFGLGAAFCALLTLFFLPPILNFTETVSKQRTKPEVVSTPTKAV